MENDNIWQTPVLHVGNYTLVTSQVLTFVVVLLVTYIIARIIRNIFYRLTHKDSSMTVAHLYIIGRFAQYSIYVVGFVLAISVLGIDMGKLALMASALGVGIGLGLQGIVNNFVSGLAILLERSLKVGDFIELDSGLTGEVIEIHMRATLIRTNDNVDILIPNAELTNGKVINWTLEESVRRFRIPLGVAYGSDKELVKKAVLEAANSVSYTIKTPGREPIVWMSGFGDSSLNFVLGVWVTAEQVKRPTALTSDYLWAIDDHLRKYKIEIPFPQRDLHIRSDQTK
ncbi:mechanosensitive ion channel [Dasania sp. GY-MA-18]|uniref:Mechanosensitive ion channel n=1 Tax=Dasania phycosphaerae TaxID=2950436 RepID=A0A9J6RLX1_9GAMM|nr:MULTISPECIES: mechanosensitive ion channel domain-containing protein [Dasania]MCR8922947.1 mechanosensitive ion channel [Dasania sp. GY-MA-18]MCZ0865378.1 mechanosensitive ion channel [Dasania phycosphaerae]MCZ0869103.1 mechanosensitive ion channel [Dasania phycosphaerae]